MRTEGKQLVPVLVRARLDGDNEIVYDYIDGLHRLWGLSILAWNEAGAEVMYGCSDEKMYDLRVISASSVPSIQYARVAQWVQSSFSTSVWADKGFTLTQVFSLAVNDSSGRNLGLTKQEGREAKQWAKEKAKIWNRPLVTIWQVARTVDAADPQLVPQVRLSSGRNSKGILTPARLTSIARPLAKEYGLQRKVVEVVLKQNRVRIGP
jgi:hypothetical protein